MADPTARFVLSAHDSTGAAFRSADKNLQQFRRSAMGVRNLLGSFGIVFSARAFAGWIKGSLDATDAVGEQRQAVESAQQALAAFRKSSDSLAESIAVGLTPAINGLAITMKALRQTFAPTEPELFENEIARIETEISRLAKGLVAFEEGKFWHRIFFDEKIAAASRTEIERLRVELQKLYDERDARANKPSSPAQDFESMWRNLQAELSIYETIEKERAALLQRTQAEEVATETMLFDLFRDIEAEKLKIRQDEFESMWTNLSAELEIYDEIAEAAKKSAKESADAYNDFAVSMGQGLRSAFSQFIADGEFKFRNFLQSMAAELATSAIFSAFAGLAGGPTTFLGQLFGGSRAMTGPVEAGKIYKVHRGEAFFAPGEDGRVGRMREGTAGPSVTVVQNNDFRGTDPSAAARIAQALERNKQQTKAEIAELIRRGRFSPA